MPTPTDWKYYIPHVWDTDTTCWEDVYLLPDIPLPSAEEIRSIWLTIDSLAFYDQDPCITGDRNRAEVLRLLGEADFLIEGNDMVVRDEVMTKERVVHWARLFLEHSGFPVAAMREAQHDEFSDTNEHATIVAALKALKAGGA